MKPKIPAIFIVALLFIAIVAAYASSFGSGFMEDDFLLLNGNLRLNPSAVVFRPFLNGLFGLEYFLFGHNTDGFRWVNIILFAGVCSSIYFFMAQVFQNRLLSMLTAFFFAVHPINQNMVLAFSTAYVSLQVMFTLGAIYWGGTGDIRIRAGTGTRPYIGWVFFILALLCHETAMLVPLYIFCFALIVREQAWQKAFRTSLPFLLILASYILFRLMATDVGVHLLGNVKNSPLDVWKHMATFFRLVHWYLSNLFTPDGIVVIWSSKIVTHGLWVWLMTGLLWLFAGVYCFWRSARLPVVRLGLLWIAIGFLPATAACLHRSASNLIMEPYWFTFSSIGFFMFVAALLIELSKRRHWMMTTASALIIGYCWMMAGHIYNGMWANDRVYGMYYLEHAGDYVPANTYMANIFLRHQEPRLAEAYIINSHQEQLSTDLPRYYADKGFVDFSNQRYESAKENYLKAIAVAPGYYPCYTYLGIIALIEKDMVKAEKYFTFVMMHEPAEILSRMNMGAIYKKRGEIDRAINMYQGVLKIDPYSEIARVELIKIYITQKDKIRTQAIAKQLLKISHNPVILHNVNVILGNI